MKPFVQLTSDTGFSLFYNSGDNNEMLFPAHTHSSIEILYFTEGKHRVLCNGKEHIAEVGDVMLIRSFAEHEIFGHSSGYNRHLAIQISLGFLFNLSAYGDGTTYILNLSETNIDGKCLWTNEECESNGISDAIRRLKEEYFSKSYGFDIASIASLAQIISIMLRDAEQSSIRTSITEDVKRRIYDSLIFMRKNYKYDISEDDCAKNVSLSKYYFSRNFKAITGRSFKEHLNLIRLEAANTLLTTTEMSISDIASDCGFNSVSHFIYTYKKAKNTTPLAFRKKYKTTK